MSPVYEVLRIMTNSYFDHVGVIIDNESCLQIGPPHAQLTPSYYFLVMNRKPLILRPPKSIKDQFLKNSRLLVGKKYNYKKAAST